MNMATRLSPHGQAAMEVAQATAGTGCSQDAAAIAAAIRALTFEVAALRGAVESYPDPRS
jgi:hypothetical protein